MNDGFFRVAAVTPTIQVANCAHNVARMTELAEKASKQGAKMVIFPELCITGYTCGDLFLQEILITEAKAQLQKMACDTKKLDSVLVVGIPLHYRNDLYNCAVIMKSGQILGVVPKTHIPNYSEFYEGRHFASAQNVEKGSTITIGQTEVPFGTDILFRCASIPSLILGVEICEDLWVCSPPSERMASAGATIIANLSASNEAAEKEDYRRALAKGQSARLVCGYIYCDAGEGESTTDLVFAGHNLICENGEILAECAPFEQKMILADLDIARLINDRRRLTTFTGNGLSEYRVIEFETARTQLEIMRRVNPHPFVPNNQEERDRRCDKILKIQAAGLKQRLSHIGCKTVLIGLSGGLDSTLALLVCERAFSMLGLPVTGIRAVTMPCFGTTKRTRSNAQVLAECMQVSFEEIPITQAVTQHFRDIGQDENTYDVTFENSQARERTQVLMDLANKYNGLVIGTGDLSELALGFATYNGDHMSMYGVNASIPKTLVRHLVRYAADTAKDTKMTEVLLDILDTPVSPELLPPDGNEIAQQTENIVGPYELHDFFLYHMLRLGEPPAKIFRLACIAFDGVFEKTVILGWLKMFCRRFFTQQYKRSCLPDGPKVGSVALSPRGDFRMPSDASAVLWQKQLDEIVL